MFRAPAALLAAFWFFATSTAPAAAIRERAAQERPADPSPLAPPNKPSPWLTAVRSPKRPPPPAPAAAPPPAPAAAPRPAAPTLAAGAAPWTPGAAAATATGGAAATSGGGGVDGAAGSGDGRIAKLRKGEEDELPLLYEWKLWEQVQGGDYGSGIHVVGSFRSVQGFWRLWNNLPHPGGMIGGGHIFRQEGPEMKQVNALSLFREGVKPAWEDPLNEIGGHFKFLIAPRDYSAEQMDQYWDNLVMGTVGGTIEPNDMITGVRMVDKLAHKSTHALRIEVWFTNYDDSAAVSALRDSVETIMCNELPRIYSTTESHKSH